VFDKLVQVLVFGCAYHKVADRTCSATTLRRRRDEWIEAGVMRRLEQSAGEAHGHGGGRLRPSVRCCGGTGARHVLVEWAGVASAS
jgi:transposase